MTSLETCLIKQANPTPVPQSPSPGSTPRSIRIQEEMRFKVLRALEQQPDLSQRQLADMLGVSLGKANYLLHALLDKGLLKARNFRNSQNKLASRVRHQVPLLASPLRARPIKSTTYSKSARLCSGKR